MCICRRVSPDYAADLSVPIMDRGRNGKIKRLLDHVHCKCTVYICLPNYHIQLVGGYFTLLFLFVYMIKLNLIFNILLKSTN